MICFIEVKTDNTTEFIARNQREHTSHKYIQFSGSKSEKLELVCWCLRANSELETRISTCKKVDEKENEMASEAKKKERKKKKKREISERHKSDSVRYLPKRGRREVVWN